MLGLSEDQSGGHTKSMALGKLMKCSVSQCLHLDDNNHGLDRDGYVFWSHECLLHTRGFVEGTVYAGMRGGGDGGISGRVRGGGGWSWQMFFCLHGTLCVSVQ